MKKVFREIDFNKSGKLDKNEILRAMKEMGNPMTPQEVDDVMRECDKDKDGQINYDEFVESMSK